MSKQNYIIDNLDEFTDSARRLVYNGFGKGAVEDPDEFTELVTKISPDEEQELNKILTHDEALIIVKSMAKQQKHKYEDKSRYLIDEKIFSEIIEAMNARLVSNILTNLANKGMIESAYDSDINDFVFWVKDNEPPETD